MRTVIPQRDLFHYPESSFANPYMKGDGNKPRRFHTRVDRELAVVRISGSTLVSITPTMIGSITLPHIVQIHIYV